MSKKVELALAKLNTILPLQANQKSLSDNSNLIYQTILKTFIFDGGALSLKVIKQKFKNADDAIKLLAKLDMITLTDNGDIDGAYPFSCQKTEHKIAVNGFILNAMCAMDALAISCMFNIKTTISSQCRVSQTPIKITQNNRNTQCNLPNIYFAINWGASNLKQSCSESLCMDMIFLKDTKTANVWLQKAPNLREVFTLNEAIEFANCFFSPLLD